MAPILAILTCLALLPLSAQAVDTPETRAARERMVREQIQARGISDPSVLAVVAKVPRHLFVPESERRAAYHDGPLPIGEGQTISQPYIVALMTELLHLKHSERVLEIGTGSGYQAAVLAALGAEVYTIEIKKILYETTDNLLKTNGYDSIKTRHGDGYFGWSEAAPFDAIMITAAVDHIPPPLIAQLKDGGRLVLPLGSPFGYQNLVLVTRRGEDFALRQVTGVLFVPMTGRALEKK
ncbi:MAG: protein-L-isoaspartate(D-aspartate) O-methyltransferase [Desulfobacterales bacterium]|nr:protein-L-isoaspartate(D-aspartate) O-methyltransferase [Desulfobacterales bacterium]